jgi:hypothetical protein
MTKRESERGSAMLITMILISAILAGAAVLVSIQLSANKGTEITNTGMRALHCAEAGLALSRATVATNHTGGGWTGNIGTGNEPSWLASVNHDIDGDTIADFYITLEDDDDEFPTNGGSNSTTADVNNRVFIVSRCGTKISGVFTPKYADFPREVRELMSVSNITSCFNGQKGGCNNNNNGN